MVKFLQEIMEKTEAVDLELQEIPDAEVEHNEQVIGRMSEDLRRLYAVYTSCVDEMNTAKKNAKAELESIDSRKESEAAGKRWEVALSSLNNKVKTLGELFWTSLRHEMPEADLANALGIRKDWQVVSVDTECDCPQCSMPKHLAASLARIALLSAMVRESSENQPSES